MFSNNFVVSVQVGGKSLEEDRSGCVKVPFGEEYTIFLKNKNDRKATASVKIDDEHIGTFVINANSSLNLKRPADKNVAFKFVDAVGEEAKAADKGPKDDGSTGLLEVEWKLEKKYETQYPVIPLVDYPDPPWVKRGPYETKPWKWPDPIYPYDTPKITWGDNTGNPQYIYSNSVCYNSSGPSSTMRSVTNSVVPSSTNPQGLGVTVDGNKTDQNFISTRLTTEIVSTIIRLTLRGFDKPRPDQAEIKKIQNQINDLQKKLDKLSKQ